MSALVLRASAVAIAPKTSMTARSISVRIPASAWTAFPTTPANARKDFRESTVKSLPWSACWCTRKPRPVKRQTARMECAFNRREVSWTITAASESLIGWIAFHNSSSNRSIDRSIDWLNWIQVLILDRLTDLLVYWMISLLLYWLIGFFYRCYPGFAGKNCESQTGATFTDPDSYIQLSKFPIKGEVNLTFTVATKEQFGVIFYYGQSVKDSHTSSAHFSMELFRGRLKVNFDVGNYPVSTIYSYEKLDDGEFHRLEFIVKGKNLTMKIDGNKSRYVINEGPREYLPSDGRIFFGGLEKTVQTEAVKQWHFRNATSLKGLLVLDHFISFNSIQFNIGPQSILRFESLSFHPSNDWLIDWFFVNELFHWLVEWPSYARN